MTPLYRRVLGHAFSAMAPTVQQLHQVDGPTVWRGTASVRRGTNPLSRLMAALFSLPPAGHALALTVSFTPDAAGHETWHRDFAGRRFLSIQSDHGGGVIAERIGRVTLLLRPTVSAGELTLTLDGARCLGLPLPRVLLPRVATREFEQAGRYHFDVTANLPLLGLLVHYRGTLELSLLPLQG
jgi:hypothetical protein